MLKPNGTFWLAIGDDYAAELKLVFQKELGFTCRSWVIWYYTFGVNCTKKFSRSHTHLFHFVKDPKHFTFNDDAIRVPSARQLVYADGRADSRGRLPDDTWILRPQDLPEGFQPDEDTWYFPPCLRHLQGAGRLARLPDAGATAGPDHPCLLQPGDLVLDPFAGSGTTLVVAKKLGRRRLGFELSANYAAKINSRLESVVSGQALEGAEEPKVSAPPTPAAAGGSPPSAAGKTLKIRAEPADNQRGVIEAFFAARDGFSADRVIADPELNDGFLQVCRRLGLSGTPFDWNWQLLNLRKAGRFKGLPTPNRTRLTRQEIDDYSYACEIGLRGLAEAGQSLDHVLCDPREAKKFDTYVRCMISGKATPFIIRWVALYLRKRADGIKKKGQRLTTIEPLPREHQQVALMNFTKLPPEPGLYWLESRPDKKLYVGKTLDLRRRFQLQFEKAKFDFWQTEQSDLQLRYCESDRNFLDANQSRWIAKWKPVGNFMELAAS